MGTSRGLQAVADEKTPFNTKHQRRTKKRKTDCEMMVVAFVFSCHLKSWLATSFHFEELTTQPTHEAKFWQVPQKRAKKGHFKFFMRELVVKIFIIYEIVLWRNSKIVI